MVRPIKHRKWSFIFSRCRQADGWDTQMEIPAIKRRSLSEEIADRLIQLILQGKLKPAQKLPPERELAEMLQVSRPSLREALRALAMRNIIEIRQGDGTYVTSLTPDLLLEPLDFLLSLDESSFFHLFEARKILEPGIAALAAERISDEDLNRLDECVRRMKASADDPDAYLQADQDMHNTILKAAGNPVLTRIMMSVSGLSLASRRRTVDLPGVRVNAPLDHQAIVDALRAHEAEKSRQMMLRHLTNVENALRVAMSSESELK